MSARQPPPPPARSAHWEPFTVKAQEAFEAQKDGKPVTRFREVEVRLQRWTGPATPLVPVVDPHYTFRAELLREFAWATWPHDNGPWSPAVFSGPPSAGKTSLVEQIAARCNVPVHRINLNVGTSVAQLKGRKGAADGQTTFIPGVVTQAMEEGGWLVLDELSGASPPVALALFPVLEPTGAVMLEDEQPPRYVVRHPNFRAYGTDNTIGADQESTRFDFAGTSPELNQALLDRFLCTVPVGYMHPTLEFDTIKARVPGVAEDHLEGMIRVANNVRAGKAVGVGFSHRMLMEWARRVAAGRLQPDGTTKDANTVPFIVESARPAFLDRMRSQADRAAVLEVINRLFNLKGG